MCAEQPDKPAADPLTWSPRVRPEKIRRLYESDARGLLNEELLDEVGFAFYARGLDILEVSEAVRGRVKCRGCGLILPRQELGQPEEKHEILRCDRCGWQIAWGDYLASYRGQRLYAGLADAVFVAYIREWETARSPQEKILAIDNLIHAFHLFQGAPGRPVGINMIHGNAREVIELIDELAYGPGSTTGLAERRDWWRSQFEQNLCFPALDFLHDGQAALPEFGEKAPGVDYLLRPGAYAVIFDKQRRLAVVRAGQGVFLPGGGALPGEIPEDTLRREVGEECGRQVRILGKIGEALSHLFAPGEGRHYTIHGHFYRASFGKMTHDPVESDHYLAWLELQEAVENLRPDQAWAVHQAHTKKGTD